MQEQDRIPIKVRKGCGIESSMENDSLPQPQILYAVPKKRLVFSCAYYIEMQVGMDSKQPLENFQQKVDPFEFR